MMLGVVLGGGDTAPCQKKNNKYTGGAGQYLFRDKSSGGGWRRGGGFGAGRCHHGVKSLGGGGFSGNASSDYHVNIDVSHQCGHRVRKGGHRLRMHQGWP